MKSQDIEFSRVTRSVKDAEKYYSRLSRVYDWLAASEKRFIHQGLEVLNPRLGEYILEIGFGTGFAQKKIITSIGDGLSAGLDLSSGMARTCHQNLVKAGIIQKQALVINDTLPIPFQSGIFDGVFTSFTLELFDTPQLSFVLKETLRVLKDNGRLVIVCLSKDYPLPLAGRFYEKIHNRYPRLADCRPIPVIQLVNNENYQIKGAIHTRMWGLPVTILEAIKATP